MTEKPERSIDTITSEILTIKDQTRRMFLSAVVEIGRRLEEAKEKVPQGEWTEYLTGVLGFRPSTAQNYMRIARKLGGDQVGLGGKSTEEIFGGLSYSQLLPIVGLPEEEAREIAEENELAEMSSREIEKLVADYKAAKSAESMLHAKMEQLEEKKKKAEKAAAAAEEAEHEEKEARKAAEARAKELEGWVKSLMDAQKAQTIMAEVMPDEAVLERERERVREETRQALAQAQQRAAAAEEKLEKARNPAAVRVNFLFGEMQSIVVRIASALDELRREQPEAAEKFGEAIGQYARQALGAWSEEKGGAA